METWRSSAAGPSARRFEVTDSKGEQPLFLKETDLTVSKLARILKITPQSIFLEDDMTSHAEFPGDNGVFQVADMSTVSRYKVCGVAVRPDDVVPISRPWSVDRPWSSGGKFQQKAPLSSKKPDKSTIEPLFRRTFTFVSLTLDKTKRKVLVDIPEENVYVRIPERNVSINTILSEMEKRINIPENELIILDSGCVPVTDDDKDIEYWRTPSRKLYVARFSEYQDLAKRRKRLGLSLGKRRNEDSSDQEEKVSKLEETVDVMKKTVQLLTENIKTDTNLKSAMTQVTQQLECKICTNMPKGPVMVTTCCHQLLGCRECYDRATAGNQVCPLCRNANVAVVPLHGFEGITLETDQ